VDLPVSEGETSACVRYWGAESSACVRYWGAMGDPDQTSSQQHRLLYASKRELHTCNKKVSVFLMPFNTHKEERCKLIGF